MRLFFGLWLAVHVPTVGSAGEPDSPVFHGVDPRIGERLSRVTVELIAVGGVEGTPAVTGFQARRFHDGRAHFGLQSFDGDIRRVEGNALTVRVDGEAYQVPFQKYDSLVIGVPGRLPPIHQLWFGPLTEPLQARLRGAKQISVEFGNSPSGGRAVYTLAERSTQKISEVMQEMGGQDGSPK